MNYKMIVAICNGGGIGKSNTLPWYSPKDLRHFSKLTRGEPPINKDTGIQKMNVMVMGRNTWNSIPKKPLPKRFHIILTRKPETLDLSDKKFENCVALSSIDAVDKFYQDNQNKFHDLWIIGGQTIYDTYLKERKIQTIFVSHIDQNHDCDVFFPYDLTRYNEKVLKKEIENDIPITFYYYSTS